MEEKIVIKGKLKDIKMFCIGIAVIGSIFPVLYFLGDLSKGTVKSDGALPYIMLIVPVFLFLGYWIYKDWSKIELTVSDKRVYGSAAFGKRVDLPLDSVSAVGTSIFKGISISTASGAIKFYMMENRDEIHKEISKLLVDRQNKPAATVTQEVSKSSADELEKFKDLLDKGVITEEEFEAKKKQLLGL